ncbi:MAG: DUF5110 domain-containing protein [Tyzzerella sp.]|nr:DUF5110 domain-containing protein [Tyzzerella sp.]
MKDNKRFIYETRPLALSQNMVSGDKYRFTVLTPSLIRMEYSKEGIFEDRASQSVFFRDFPENHFSKECSDGWLKIETENLIVMYKENEEFSAETLSLKLKIEPASTWHFGEDFEDLGGTTKTLDDVNGATPLERGVCSRNGFSVMDDSNTMLLNEIGWVEVRVPETVDCYFWGYGFNYLDAVKDLYRLTGVPPMLPAYALGNWWSRYHKYTQDEYQGLIERFEKEEIPFSVSVVDMDWHITKIPEECKNGEGKQFENGWTGYSWNKEFFPDYKGFLKFLKEHNLKTSLNLHPAQGVGCHEDMYEEMARACGIDPATRERVRLDILSPEFMEKYFDILHHPYEEDGVDFWWMDWQQGTSYWWIHEENKDGNMQDEREILDPLWMLNHLHIADIKRNGKRPMFFSRFSGPGSQRYPVGFSGDTYVTWASLDFQPYFTATSSNVGYSWWSHDIGGHMGGYRDGELITRWMQLGVFSPINRLHSANTEFIRKEPWCFEEKTEAIMKNWLRLRHRLFPYIYTMNYRNNKELEPLVQPMYYAYPKRNAAYEMKNQFMFGSELMVAPITKPNNKITQMGSANVWLPEGDWFDFFSGTHYTSKTGRTLSVHRKINDYPVFAKAGAIVPMQNSYELEAGNDLEIVIFPGADNSFKLYEDAGDGSEFENGEYVKTEMNLKWSNSPVFTVKPPLGAVEKLLPEERNYKFIFRGYHENIAVTALVDGYEVPVAATYDEATRAMIVEITADVTSEIKLHINGAELITDNGDALVRCSNLLQKAELDMMTKVEVMKVLKDENRTYYNKIRTMNFKCASSNEHQDLVEALLEQLTLVE